MNTIVVILGFVGCALILFAIVAQHVINRSPVDDCSPDYEVPQIAMYSSQVDTCQCGELKVRYDQLCSGCRTGRPFPPLPMVTSRCLCGEQKLPEDKWCISCMRRQTFDTY